LELLKLIGLLAISARILTHFTIGFGVQVTKPLNIGMIGYGFMGRAHSNAYSNVNHFFDLEYRPVLKAVCARDKGKAQAFASQWGYESIETDWRKLLARKDIDAVDICTPNNLHKEIAIASAEAG
jgi:predicted dehydrogenase